MRLSAYNEGSMHNIVYLLTDGPRKIRSIPEEFVMRQLSGDEVLRNVTQPLPLRIIGGTVTDLQEWHRQSLVQQRNPTPHNGFAKELFASDLLAVKTDRLSHPHEEDEKMLLRIGEHLGLRGPVIDKLNLAFLDAQREKALKDSLDDAEEDDAHGHRRRLSPRGGRRTEPDLRRVPHAGPAELPRILRCQEPKARRPERRHARARPGQVAPQAQAGGGSLGAMFLGAVAVLMVAGGLVGLSRSRPIDER